MKMTRKLGNYLEKHCIDAKLVSEATGVNMEVLQKNPIRSMNATEFLEVCAYLRIKPEELAAGKWD